MLEHVDPFIGTAATDLPAPYGLAATWWWPKPQVGNTHPGAAFPFGMVSASAYSGAYPTGYGRYELNTEGVPVELYDRLIASGFTHFQQSGTGAIRKYYNYFRVTPMLEPLDSLGDAWELAEERAEPGYYACTLSSGIRCELTVGPRHIRPNGRRVVGRIRSKSSRVPPCISRRSYQSSCRQSPRSHSTCTASGAPSTTVSAWATPGPSVCRCDRSGTVAP